MTRGVKKYHSFTDLTLDEYPKVKNTKSKINYLIPLWTLEKNTKMSGCETKDKQIGTSIYHIKE